MGVITLLVSCEGDTEGFNANYNFDLEVIENPISAHNYLKDSNDPDGEKIQINLHEIGLEFRDILSTGEYNEIIFQEARFHNNSCITIEALLDRITMLDNDHSKEASRLKKLIPDWDFTRRVPNSPENASIENYIPAIFAINHESADFSLAPIVSAGVYVNPEFPETQNYDEYIVAWLYNSDENKYQEILLDEEMVEATAHPVLIIDNADLQMFNVYGPVQFESSESAHSVSSNYKMMGKKLFAIDHFKLNHRFETFGKSEFAASFINLDENENHHQMLKKSNGTYQTELTLTKVPKADIGTWITNEWFSITDIANQATDLEPFSTNYLWWNLFERDWAKSTKPLLTGAKPNGKMTYLGGRRKNSSDYYMYDPDANNDANHLPMSTIWTNGHKFFSSANGAVKIIKYEQ